LAKHGQEFSAFFLCLADYYVVIPGTAAICRRRR